MNPFQAAGKLVGDSSLARNSADMEEEDTASSFPRSHAGRPSPVRDNNVRIQRADAERFGFDDDLSSSGSNFGGGKMTGSSAQARHGLFDGRMFVGEKDRLAADRFAATQVVGHGPEPTSSDSSRVSGPRRLISLPNALQKFKQEDPELHDLLIVSWIHKGSGPSAPARGPSHKVGTVHPSIRVQPAFQPPVGSSNRLPSTSHSKAPASMPQLQEAHAALPHQPSLQPKGKEARLDPLGPSSPLRTEHQRPKKDFSARYREINRPWIDSYLRKAGGATAAGKKQDQLTIGSSSVPAAIKLGSDKRPVTQDPAITSLKHASEAKRVKFDLNQAPGEGK